LTTFGLIENKSSEASVSPKREAEGLGALDVEALVVAANQHSIFHGIVFQTIDTNSVQDRKRKPKKPANNRLANRNR